MKQIDKLFKEKLYNHEATVPEGMWDKIAPIAEEESGRAIMWFWFAGLLALLLGGFGIYNLINSNATNTPIPSTLVNDIEIDVEPTNILVDNNLTTEKNTPKEKDSITEVITTTSSNIESQQSTTTAPTVNIQQSKPINVLSNDITIQTESVKIEPKQNISNTIESIQNANGVPANLVITKSYINKEGSIIKQSNLTDDSNNEGSYDIIFNSETKDFNAGALLRIIEPLENIPLPAFQKPLKKKTIEKSLF